MLLRTGLPFSGMVWRRSRPIRGREMLIKIGKNPVFFVEQSCTENWIELLAKLIELSIFTA